MGQDADQIRREIETTRAEMKGETVGAIGYKTDVKARTRDKVTDTKDSIVSKISGATRTRATPSTGRSGRRGCPGEPRRAGARIGRRGLPRRHAYPLDGHRGREGRSHCGSGQGPREGDRSGRPSNGARRSPRRRPRARGDRAERPAARAGSGLERQGRRSGDARPGSLIPSGPVRARREEPMPSRTRSPHAGSGRSAGSAGGSTGWRPSGFAARPRPMPPAALGLRRRAPRRPTMSKAIEGRLAYRRTRAPPGRRASAPGAKGRAGLSGPGRRGRTGIKPMNDEQGRERPADERLGYRSAPQRDATTPL